MTRRLLNLGMIVLLLLLQLIVHRRSTFVLAAIPEGDRGNQNDSPPATKYEQQVNIDTDDAAVNATGSILPTATTTTRKRRSKRISLLDPEIIRLRRQYWKDTFADIRSLQQRGSSSGTANTFPSKTTTTTTGRKARFEGFTSWERLLQDWSEDIQDYLEQADASQQQQRGYAMGNYGRGSSSSSAGRTTTNSTTDLGEKEEDTDGGTALKDATVDREYVVPQSTTTTDATATSNGTSTTSPTKTPLPSPQPALPGEPVLPHTSLPNKRVLIVTTASLPWQTGTAVNPLLRAAYLVPHCANVTLLLPWLERPEDQKRVYNNRVFASPAEQEATLRTWLRDTADCPLAAEQLRLQWYTAWQNPIENSVYSMGDITSLVPNHDYDICILEEPEHLNWYRAPGESWTKKFPHVVGILHTNYFAYALDQPAAVIRAPAMQLLCAWMCRAHCHRIVKLSATLSPVAPEKELVCNTHGVRAAFLEVGRQRRKTAKKHANHDDNDDIDNNSPRTPPRKAYFIGKLLWSKGLGSLMELMKYADESANLTLTVDMYGGGPDAAAAEAKAQRLHLDMPFPGPLDHIQVADTHSIFINPSTSEVLCTTTAEALAMGKFVILPSHPSNDFFTQFPNCLSYATKDEFVGNVYYALTHDPEPLTEAVAHTLSWEAATERLMAAACIPTAEWERWNSTTTDSAASTSMEETGIEIPLPSLLENQDNRKVYRLSRYRYRLFRTRLSQEVRDNKVLPKRLRDRIMAELDKRLDIDIDALFESPTLRVKLSPAELDKSLLELYDAISESPGGDILRVIGGGGQIAFQNLYMRRHAEREWWRRVKTGTAVGIFPKYVDDDEDDEDDSNGGSVSQRIRSSLRRNVPKLGPLSSSSLRAAASKEEERNKRTTNNDNAPPSMILHSHGAATVPEYRSSHRLRTWTGLRPPVSFATKLSLRI